MSASAQFVLRSTRVKNSTQETTRTEDRKLTVLPKPWPHSTSPANYGWDVSLEVWIAKTWLSGGTIGKVDPQGQWGSSAGNHGCPSNFPMEIHQTVADWRSRPLPFTPAVVTALSRPQFRWLPIFHLYYFRQQQAGSVLRSPPTCHLWSTLAVLLFYLLPTLNLYDSPRAFSSSSKRRIKYTHTIIHAK